MEQAKTYCSPRRRKVHRQLTACQSAPRIGIAVMGSCMGTGSLYKTISSPDLKTEEQRERINPCFLWQSAKFWHGGTLLNNRGGSIKIEACLLRSSLSIVPYGHHQIHKQP